MIAAVLVTVAIYADLVSANLAGEFNPLARQLLADPRLAFAAKTAEIALILAVVAIGRRRHPRIASLVVVAGVAGGTLGALSNVPL